MYEPTPSDILRVAVALCALKEKPQDQGIDSYVLDLQCRARGESSAAITDWRILALALESQLRDNRAEDLQLEKPTGKKGKQVTRAQSLDARSIPPSCSSSLPIVLSTALSSALKSSSKLDTLSSRLISDMQWALPDGILFPAVDAFLPLSLDLYTQEKKDEAPDSREALLRLLLRALPLVDDSVRRDVGLRALDKMCASDLGVEKLVLKDTLWYYCSVIAASGVEEKGADKLCRFLLEDQKKVEAERLHVVEREMIEGVLEKLWLDL